MKTHKILCSALIATFAIPAFAQQERINDFRTTDEEGLIETVAKIEKKTDKFNLILNMHSDFKMDWNGSHFDQGKFEMQQLRLEMKGNITDWLSYRYRQRLNKTDRTGSNFDNILKSIDIAGVGFKLGKWNAFVGKQCASYGGIEFDWNPIEIYQYSDQVEYMDNFLTGVNIGYDFTPNQQLNFQVVNAYNTSSNEMYGNYEKAKLPLNYTLNWNGNFNDVYKTRWSASFMNETKNKHQWYFALGNDFNISDKVQAYFDWMYSIQGVDRKGIMTQIVGEQGPGKNAMNASYMSFVWHINYRFHPAWNIFAKVMYENEGIYKSHTTETGTHVAAGNYRTALGYIGGIEYYPFKDRNLHFFATYVGRDYKFTSKAKALGQENYSTNQLQVGFIWAMPIF